MGGLIINKTRNNPALSSRWISGNLGNSVTLLLSQRWRTDPIAPSFQSKLFTTNRERRRGLTPIRRPFCLLWTFRGRKRRRDGNGKGDLQTFLFHLQNYLTVFYLVNFYSFISSVRLGTSCFWKEQAFSGPFIRKKGPFSPSCQEYGSWLARMRCCFQTFRDILNLID